MSIFRIGSWGTPEFGVTERLQSILQPNNTSRISGGSNLVASSNDFLNAGGRTNTGYNPSFTPPPVRRVPSDTSGQVLGDNVGVPSSATRSTNNPQQYIDRVNESVNELGSLLDQDYNNAIGALGAQEQGLRSQADTAQQQLGADYGATMAALGSEESTATQGVTGQLNTAETGAKSAMQQARDLFRQTQQSNIAQLSALGISSSSVSEALAERLGVETARRISGVTGSLQEVRQNASKEMARIGDYYAQKKTELEKTKTIETSKIQQTLINGLNQINHARNQAQIDKARSRYELISNARAQIDQINQQSLQFQQSLDAWAAQKSNALNKFISDPALLQSYQRNIETLNRQPGITQTFLGNYGVNQNGSFGYMPGALRSVNRRDQEEENNGVGSLSWQP